MHHRARTAISVAIAETAPVPLMGVDVDGMVVFWNPAATALLGWTADQVLGRTDPSVPPDLADMTRALRESVFAGQSRALDTRRLHRDGATIDVLLTMAPMYDDAGRIVAAVATMEDLAAVTAAEAIFRSIAREKQDRRSHQNATVADFAQRAMAEANVDELAMSALEHVAAAIAADYAELLEASADGTTLQVVHRLTTHAKPSAPGELAVDSGAIAAEAFAAHEPVTRKLTDVDFAAAPHLAAGGLRWGAATAVRADERVSTIAVYSRERLWTEPDLYPLQAIAALYAGAAARRRAEQQLAEREATLRLMFEQMPALIWAVDRELVYISSHGSALRTFGRKPNEVVGQNILSTFPEETAPVRAIRAALRGEPGAYFYEYREHAFDNRVEPLRDAAGNVVGAVTLSFDVTERTRTEKALRGSREELRRLSAQLDRIQEEERRRIAREVHDELGQRLTALRLDLLLLRASLPAETGSEADSQVAGMLALIDETIATVRRVATALRPAMLDDFGFHAAVEHELMQLRIRTGIDYTITVTPDEYPLEVNRATALYRIMQEVLTNIARHSGATHVEFRFHAQNGWIYVDVEDNGRGITPAQIEDETSLGLMGVRERAIALGGDVVITGKAGVGTHVAVRIPDTSA